MLFHAVWLNDENCPAFYVPAIMDPSHLMLSFPSLVDSPADREWWWGLFMTSCHTRSQRLSFYHTRSLLRQLSSSFSQWFPFQVRHWTSFCTSRYTSIQKWRTLLICFILSTLKQVYTVWARTLVHKLAVECRQTARIGMKLIMMS